MTYEIIKNFDISLTADKFNIISSNKITYQNQRIYLQTPEMSISQINQRYVFLTIDPKLPKSQPFIDTLNEIDQIFRIFQTETRDVFEILRKYRNMLVDDFTDGLKGLVLDIEKTQLFDQYGDKITIENLVPEYRCRGLILLDGLEIDGVHLILKQLRITIPENILDHCILSDSEVDEEV